MAKLSKPAIRRLTILVFVLAAISLTLFSCSTYCAQGSKTYLDMSKAHLRQLEEPENDAPAAVVHTSLGDITAVLYPEEAPVYVEQFTRLAKEGYYDGTYIYQVQSGVYFSAGSKDNTGVVDSVQNASSEEKIAAEKSANLWPLRGAFCVPLTGHDRSFWNNLFGKAADYCGTRFLVCDTIAMDAATKADLEKVDESAKDITDAFLERGGVPNYSQQMTIFAQAYGDESFETIDKITEVKTADADPETEYTRPLEDILIENIEITTWGEVSK